MSVCPCIFYTNVKITGFFAHTHRHRHEVTLQDFPKYGWLKSEGSFFTKVRFTIDPDIN